MIGVVVLLLLAAALAYPWGYSLITGMLVGAPDRRAMQWCLGLFAAFSATAVFVAPSGVTHDGRWRIGLGALGLFAATSLAILLLRAADTPARPVAIALYVAGSLSVVWLGMMPLWPMRLPARTAVLAGLSALLGTFVALIRIAGLSGDAKVEFAWRRPAAAVTLQGASPPAFGEARIPDPPGPDDFPSYLGPARDGRVARAGLGDWRASPPAESWRRPVGAGWGGFAVAGNVAVTQEQRGDREAVVCYELDSGREMWVHSDPIRFDSSLGGPGPRATPALAHGRVYAIGATGRLNCLSAEGRLEWSVDTIPGAAVPHAPVTGAGAEEEPEASGELLSHGTCGSPLVVDGRVWVSPSGRDGRSLAAFDAKTGAELLRAGRDRASYASPMLATLGGQSHLLVFNGAGLAGHDPVSGDVRWTFPWTNDVRTNCAQPLVIDRSRLLVSTGYGTGSALLDVRRHDDGAWQATERWRSRDMKAKFATPVLKDGLVYGLDDGILACIDPETGKRLWKRGRYGHGQVLLAGDTLVVQTEPGPVVLVRPGPDGPEELGSIPALSDKTWNTIALAGDRLLVRNAVEAACYRLPHAAPIDGDARTPHGE